MLSSERTHWLQNVISGKFPTSRDLAIARLAPVRRYVFHRVRVRKLSYAGK